MVNSRVIDTMIAETGADEAGLRAVAAVINNRAKAFGLTPAQVVAQQGQFQGYSNPGSASVRAQKDASLRAKAEQAFNDISSGKSADPTNGGLSFRASNTTKGMAAPHGSVTIAGNTFAKGNGAPQTALGAIDAIAPPLPRARPGTPPALAYAPPAPLTPPSPSVRAISINPNGSPVAPQMQLPQSAMYGINRLSPGHVTQAPTDFTTQSVGVPDGRMAALSAPTFQRPGASVPLPRSRPDPYDTVNGRIDAPAPRNVWGVSDIIREANSSPALTSHPVHTVPIDPMTGNPVGQNAAPSLQDALNSYALRQAANRSGSIKTVPQAGNVALPPGVVPKQAAADLASISSRPFDGASVGGSGGWNLAPPQTAGAAPVPHPYPITPSFPPFTPNGIKVASANGPTIDATAPLDYSRLGLPKPPALTAINNSASGSIPLTSINPKPGQTSIGADGTEYQYVQKSGGIGGTGNATYGWERTSIGPFGGSRATGTASRLPTVPVPSVAAPSSGLQPLTKFLPANKRQNDTLTTLGNNVGNALSATGPGHIYSLLTGGPVNGGGLLNSIFGYGGMLNQPRPATAASAPVPQPIAPDTARYLQAQSDLRNSGMIDQFGMLTGSGGHGDAAH